VYVYVCYVSSVCKRACNSRCSYIQPDDVKDELFQKTDAVLTERLCLSLPVYLQICTYPTHPLHTHTQLGIQKDMVIGEVEALLSEFQPLGYLNPKGLLNDDLPPEQIELQYVSYQIGNTQKLLRALGIFFVFIKLECFACMYFCQMCGFQCFVCTRNTQAHYIPKYTHRPTNIRYTSALPSIYLIFHPMQTIR
jgi:hypothetical protein